MLSDLIVHHHSGVREKRNGPTISPRSSGRLGPSPVSWSGARYDRARLYPFIVAMLALTRFSVKHRLRDVVPSALPATANVTRSLDRLPLIPALEHAYKANSDHRLAQSGAAHTTSAPRWRLTAERDRRQFRGCGRAHPRVLLRDRTLVVDGRGARLGSVRPHVPHESPLDLPPFFLRPSIALPDSWMTYKPESLSLPPSAIARSHRERHLSVRRRPAAPQRS